MPIVVMVVAIRNEIRDCIQGCLRPASRHQMLNNVHGDIDCSMYKERCPVPANTLFLHEWGQNVWDQKSTLATFPAEALERPIVATFGLRPKGLLKNAHRLIIKFTYGTGNSANAIDIFLAGVPRKNLNSSTDVIPLLQRFGARAPSTAECREVFVRLVLCPLQLLDALTPLHSSSVW